MKDHPILFSAPMIRAILAGTKTQTRRVAPIRKLDILQQPGDLVTWSVSFLKAVKGVLGSHSGGKLSELQASSIIASQFNPYGKPGDRLWVRETWMDLQGTGVEVRTGDRGRYAYAADTPPGSYGDMARKDYGLKWRPSIHMPRAASRILLEVTDVRVERLQAISEADAIAEGIVRSRDGSGFQLADTTHYSDSPIDSYFSLWEAINGPGSVEANPYVWVVEFERVAP